MNAKFFAPLLLLNVAGFAQTPDAQTIDILNPAARAIIPEKAHLEKFATGLDRWTEGPVWTKQGFLLFAEIPANNIDRLSATGAVSVFLHPSGYLGADAKQYPEPGSNGMTLDSDGRLTVAGHARRNLYRLESMDPSAQITVLADSYKGKQLNSPNDLVYRSDGSLYFTDPPYGLPTQDDKDPQKQLTVNGVYRIPNARSQKPGSAPRDADLQLLISDLPRPNGIAFSPDEKFLYVSDSQKKIWMRYNVAPDGSLSNGRVFADANGAKGNGGPDGVKVDTEGNLYGAGPGGVWIMSPSGKHLATIKIPETVGNLTWGDSDAKMLYITASTSVYRIGLKITGIMSANQ